MSWADEIDHAMRRGNSPYTSLDLLRLAREGRAEIYIWPRMHASSVLLNDTVEIGHVFGEWTPEEAQELWARLLAFCVRHGKSGGIVKGRPGWRRFLRMKGFQT